MGTLCCIFWTIWHPRPEKQTAPISGNSCQKTKDWISSIKILCMDNSRLVKRVCFSDTVEGKRRVGRPLLSWRQAINQDLNFFGLQHNVIIHLDENAQKQPLRIGTNEQCFLDADINWKKLRKQKRLLRKTRNSSS